MIYQIFYIDQIHHLLNEIKIELFLINRDQGNIVYFGILDFLNHFWIIKWTKPTWIKLISLVQFHFKKNSKYRIKPNDKAFIDSYIFDWKLIQTKLLHPY